MKQDARWIVLWKKLASVPYGKASVVKENGKWTSATVTQAVRATKEGLAVPTVAVRNVMDQESQELVQEAFDKIDTGTLQLDKHEGRIMSYTVTETLLTEEIDWMEGQKEI